MTSVTAKHFYRRPLPANCVDFSSEEGKKLFTESLLAGLANIYFKLASQFRTQDEPAYCGLSTLVMVLNALEVDPGRVWKAPWRFYHESMLDCCLPLETVRRTGINLAQFACLATCNRLNVRTHYAVDTPEFLAQFRRDLEESVRSDNTVLVISYSRAILGQTGDGHYSPLAALHADSDRALIMDVARFKYPPHWVTLDELHKAMLAIDKTTQNTRGYMLLRLIESSRPLVVYGLRANISEHFETAVLSWLEFLRQAPVDDPEEELLVVCRRFHQAFASFAICCKGDSCCKNGDPNAQQDFVQCSKEICAEIRGTKVATLLTSSSVVALMLAWPFERDYSERSEKLRQYVCHESCGFSVDTKNEISLLRTQLRTLMHTRAINAKASQDVFL